MTTLAIRPVADPHQLALIADDWTPLGQDDADRFRDACYAVAIDGWVDPNRVREHLTVNGVLQIDPRRYSALWSTACARDGYLDKTDRLVPITGSGSRGNTNKAVPMRRLRDDQRVHSLAPGQGSPRPSPGEGC